VSKCVWTRNVNNEVAPARDDFQKLPNKGLDLIRSTITAKTRAFIFKVE
jgi:hypothetical protein